MFIYLYETSKFCQFIMQNTFVKNNNHYNVKLKLHFNPQNEVNPSKYTIDHSKVSQKIMDYSIHVQMSK
jgi:hypothetical protein